MQCVPTCSPLLQPVDAKLVFALRKRLKLGRFGDAMFQNSLPCSCSSGSNGRDGEPSCRIVGELSVGLVMVFGGRNESGCGNQALSLRMCHFDFKAPLGNAGWWCFR